ncbi:hypothetical protein [Paenibacillus crassostreae]|uniref:hypothetical protein n=1 Tax=Paenibacillus crassostreae TaxID=1763538 RepID=UPI0008DB85C1|nr:hypothetical protein [Paenibacillus crassostreae]AOZ94861.1 hypothetical protein LPB68_21590 [Paenibacillus crassostreae]
MVQNVQEGISSLSDLITRKGDTSELQLKAFLCNNLGRNTLLAKVPMYEFYRMSEVANERSEDGTPVAQPITKPLRSWLVISSKD